MTRKLWRSLCKLYGGCEDNVRKAARMNVFQWMSCKLCSFWFHYFSLNELNIYVSTVACKESRI